MNPAPAPVVASAHHTIDETKDLIVFAIALREVIQKITAHGHFSLMSAFELAKVYRPAKAALEGIKAIPAEIADMDEAEADELCRIIGAQLNIEIKGHHARETANKALNILRSLVDFEAHLRGINPPKAEVVKEDEAEEVSR